MLRRDEASIHTGHMSIDLDKLFQLVERLRKEAIGEPKLIREKHAYEYGEKSTKIVALLKLVRSAHGVSALVALLNQGLVIDFGAILRCINDCHTEIYFLLEDYPKTSTNVDKFVRGFFENTIDGYLSTETPAVESKKIRAAMVRVLKGQHDEETRQRIDRIYTTFCGYVHANYAHIMEAYNGATLSFNLAGIPDRSQKEMRLEHIELAASGVASAAAFIAKTLDMDDLYREIMRELK